MDRDQFWSMIETARQASGGDVEQQETVLKMELRRLPLAEVIGFHRVLEHVQAESFSVELWGAAEAIVDKVSEDHFYGFRGWLVAQGQSAYQAAVADPDSLAGLPGLRAGEGMLAWGEAMWFVAAEVHQERTGGQLPPEASWRTELIGSWWPYDQHQEELRRRYHVCGHAFAQRPTPRPAVARPSCRAARGGLPTRQVSRMCGRPRPANQPGLEDVRRPYG